MYPFYRSSLIAQTKVLDPAWRSWESEYTESIGQSNDDCSGLFGKAAAIIERRVSIADGEPWLFLSVIASWRYCRRSCKSLTPAVEEDKDRLLSGILVQGRGPYVQSEAVFALRRTKTASKGVNDILGLRCKAREVDWFGCSLWAITDNARSTSNAKSTC